MRLGLALLVLASGCVLGEREEDWKLARSADGRVAYVSPAETEALAALLGEALAKAGHGGKLVVVREGTLAVTKRRSLTFPQKAADLKEQLPALDEPLWESFRRASREVAHLRARKLPMPVRNLVAAEGRITAAFKKGGWDRFRKEFKGAGAVVGVSRPGIDRKRETALFYYTLSAGAEDGSGAFVLGKKDGDGWHVAKVAVQWKAGD